MNQQYLYVIFSSTPYRIGRFIRRITGAEYNHASVSLDPQLQKMYGFARRYYRTPFYGGFVLETPARYCVDGVNTKIRVYRIPIAADAYESIRTRLDTMYQNRSHYLYNHFSAWLYPLHCRIPAKDACFCVEFCLQMLQMSGIDVAPRKHYSIDDLQTLLAQYEFYQGEMPQNGKPDEAYFSESPLPHPIYSSLRSMVALIPRIGQK